MNLDDAFDKIEARHKREIADLRAKLDQVTTQRDALAELVQDVQLGRERLGPAGWKMVQEVGRLREGMRLAKEWLKHRDEMVTVYREDLKETHRVQKHLEAFRAWVEKEAT